ncbi:hypothetical protein HZC53_03835 [Candidatus Uhrbacteria bacterium]|nr:hypothetical protein [Candidatus Uhrbacteria bacterium]
MTAPIDENDDDIIDEEDDESDDDDDQDDDVDTGWTNDDEPDEENSMDETTEKPVTKPVSTPAKPAARRVARGLLGAQSVAKAVASAKPTVQAAVPPPVVQPAPKPDLAKDGIAFTEEAFNAFLAAQGIDAATHPFAQLKVWGGVIAKKAKDALETGTSPVDAWNSAVKHVADMIPQMLAAKKLDEATASKIQAVIRYFIETLKAIEAAEAAKVKPSRIEEPKQVSAKKTAVGMAPPPKAEVAKDETPKAPTITCPKCGKENPVGHRHCLPCGTLLKSEDPKSTAPVTVQPEVTKSRATDPNAATELHTPAPGSSPTPSVPSTNGERSTITPEQRALVAAAAASIPDEQSVSYRPAPQSPKPPEAPAAPLPPPAWCVPTPQPAAPVAPPAPRVGYVPPPAAIPPSPPAAPAPQPAPPAVAQKSNKLLVVAVCILGLIAAILVWHFVVAPQVMQATPQQPVATAAVSPSETCTKVTDALVKQYYGQSKASEFSLAERPGVRLICAGKLVYKNPTTGLYDIRPCQICYK